MKRLALFVMTILVGCGAQKSEVKSEESSMIHALIGEWRNTRLKVTMNSFKGLPDSTMIIEADTTNWEEVVRMKPISTFFDQDNTYHSDHYSVSDSLLFSASGTWSVSNDTLIMKQTSPNTATYRLKTQINNDKVTFSGKLDFDEDGAEDDDYYGEQRKYDKD